MNRKVAVHRVNTEAVYFVGSGPDLVALAVEAKGKKRKNNEIILINSISILIFIFIKLVITTRVIEITSNHSR